MAEGVSSKIGSVRLHRGPCVLTSKTHAEVTVINYGYPGSQGAGPEQIGGNRPKTMSSRGCGLGGTVCKGEESAQSPRV